MICPNCGRVGVKLHCSKLAVKTSKFLSTWQGKIYRCYWCNILLFDLRESEEDGN